MALQSSKGSQLWRVVGSRSQASEAQISSLRRWQLVKRLTRDLESAWKGCYIQTIQKRNKWNREEENLEIGQIVYIKDEELIRYSRWPLGKIRIVSWRRWSCQNSSSTVKKKDLQKSCFHADSTDCQQQQQQ